MGRDKTIRSYFSRDVGSIRGANLNKRLLSKRSRWRVIMRYGWRPSRTEVGCGSGNICKRRFAAVELYRAPQADLTPLEAEAYLVEASKRRNNAQTANLQASLYTRSLGEGSDTIVLMVELQCTSFRWHCLPSTDLSCQVTKGISKGPKPYSIPL